MQYDRKKIIAKVLGMYMCSWEMLFRDYFCRNIYDDTSHRFPTLRLSENIL